MRGHAKGKPCPVAVVAAEEALPRNLYICMDHQRYHTTSLIPCNVRPTPFCLLYVITRHAVNENSKLTLRLGGEIKDAVLLVYFFISEGFRKIVFKIKVGNTLCI